MKCSQCRVEVANDSAFGPKCGASIPARTSSDDGPRGAVPAEPLSMGERPTTRARFRVGDTILARYRGAGDFC